jgi:uncharacterized protein YebE (UPF0316 family)
MDALANPILGALVIFLVRVLSITIGTVRLLIMGRANTMVVLVLASIEALAFALTFGQVAANLGNIWNLSAYCLGFACGTVTGMWVEERMAAGYATVHIVSIGHSHRIAKAIRDAGFGATRSSGEGETGTVGLVRVVTRRKNISQIVKLASNVDPDAFLTIEETRAVSHGFLEKVSGRN